MDLLNLVIRADTGGADNATSALDKTTAAAGRAKTATDLLRREMEGASRVANMLKGAMGGLLAALGFREIGRAADAWSELQARAQNAVGGIMNGGAAIMGRMEEMARRTYSSLDATAESWLSTSTSLNALGISVQDQLDMVESLNNAMVISATRGQRAESVQRAWANAMALGELRGTNLNTVLTGSDRLAQALADSLGVNVNELRSMGAAGELTRDKLMGLNSQLETLREEADRMPATMADARQIWVNTFTAIVGLTDQALGATESLAASLIGLADGVRSAADYVIRAAVLIQSGFGSAIESVTGLVSGLGLEFDATAMLIVAGAGAAGLAATALAGVLSTTLVGAIKAVTAAMLANPLGLFVAGISAAITAAYLFRDEIKQAIGIDVVDLTKSAANSVIGFFDVAFHDVKAIWSAFPAVLGDIVISAANAVIENIRWMIRTVQVEFNVFFRSLDQMLHKAGMPTLNIWAEPIKINDPSAYLDNPFAGAMDTLSLTMRTNRALSRDRDYIGEVSSALGEAWTNAEGASQSIEELMAVLQDAHGDASDLNDIIGGTGAALKAANDNATDFGKALQDAIKVAQAEFDFFRGTFNGFVMDLTRAIRAGESLWDSFGNAAVNALNKIADRYLSMAADGIFNMLFGGIFGGMLGSTSMTMGGSFFTPNSFVPGGYYPGLPGGGLLSFDGGGFTGVGPRSGGIDGRGGFPAILHPNETVTDHTRRSGNQNVTVNVQVIEQRRSGSITREETTGANGEKQVRLIVRDEVTQARRRGAPGF